MNKRKIFRLILMPLLITAMLVSGGLLSPATGPAAADTVGAFDISFSDTAVTPEVDVALAEEFIVYLLVDSGTIELGGAGFDLSWDPDMLECTGISYNDSSYFFESWVAENSGSIMYMPSNPGSAIDNEEGTITAASVALVGASGEGPAGTGIIMNIEFQALALGEATLDLNNIMPSDPLGTVLEGWSAGDGSISVVESTELPDLVVTAVTEEWVEEGSTYNVSFTVKNQGEGSAAASVAGVVIDEGAASTTVACGAMASGVSQSFTAGPFYLSGDSDEITVLADYDNDVEETLESNNFLDSTWMAKPNLEVTLVEIDWEDENESYYIEYLVENTGTVAAAASVTGITINAYQDIEMECPALPVGSSYNGTTQEIYFESGDTLIEVVADITNRIDEIDESDNRLLYTLSGLPDLIVDTLEPYWYVVNSSYKVDFTIKNQGYGTANITFATLQIDGALAATVNCTASLAAGKTLSETIGPYTLSGTQDYVKVTADSTKEVDESNESNNTKQVTWKSAADLEISDVYYFWVIEDETYKITYTVENSGSNSADSSVVDLYIDGNIVNSEECSSLTAGATATMTVGPFYLSGSKDAIRILADAEDDIDETDEANNSLESTASGLPDLVVLEQKLHWVEGLTEYEITYVVKNQGVGDNTDSCEVAVYKDGALSEVTECPTLPANGSFTMTVGPYTLSDSTDTIKIKVDRDDDVTEKNEENNEFERIWGAQPDLVIKEMGLHWVEEGMTYAVYFTIANDGTESDQASRVEVYIDDEMSAAEECPALGAGEEFRKIIGPFVLSDTSDIIRVVADVTNAVGELDESNNTLESIQSVSPSQASSVQLLGGLLQTSGEDSPETGASASSGLMAAETLLDLVSKVDINGFVLQTCRGSACGDIVTVRLRSGTIALRTDGVALSGIEVQPSASYPQPQNDKSIIGLTYGLGPNGASFSPGITLTLEYDPDLCPSGTDFNNLSLAYYDTEKMEWVLLDSTVDTLRNTVSAEVGHFTLFAVVLTGGAAIRWSLLGIILMVEVIVGMIVAYIIIQRRRGWYR